MTTNHSRPARSEVARGLVVALVLLGGSGALRLLAPAYLSSDLSRRLMGALLGLMVVVYANAVPKALAPLIRSRCDPAGEQALRRFTGWSFVLGGAAYAIGWIVAPMEVAYLVTASALGAALLLVAVRVSWASRRGGAAEARAGRRARRHARGRLTERRR